jgi:hypothetical protein
MGEVAFAVILLAGAGLFLRGLQRFENLDPGWHPDGLLTGQLNLQGERYSTPPQVRGFYEQLEERLLALPGVQRVAFSNSLPAWGFNSSGDVSIEGQPEPEPGKAPEVFFEQVSRGYFETLGLRLIAGRTFDSTDAFGRTPVVIINDTMARRFWPNQSALGKRIGRPAPERRQPTIASGWKSSAWSATSAFLRASLNRTPAFRHFGPRPKPSFET